MKKAYEMSYGFSGDRDDWEPEPGLFESLFEATMKIISMISNRRFMTDTLDGIQVLETTPSSCTIQMSENSGEEFILKIREVPHGNEK